MGRKATNGYPEKSYYDNTVFNGIVATHDPLNEGSFALLTNFDIVETGKSAVPRKGFTTTTFLVDGEPVVLSNKLLLYRDPNIQKDVIIDLNKLTDDEEDKFAFLVDITQYNIEDKMLANGRIITTYDFEKLYTTMAALIPDLSTVSNPLAFLFTNSVIVSSNVLKSIRDRDGVIYYVSKLMYSYNNSAPVYYWLKTLYREKETTVGGTTYDADTLVLDTIDTEKQVTNFMERNIASTQSIIPDPLRSQEEVAVEETEASEVNRPILLKVGTNYALTKIPESYKTSLDIKVEPTFHLQDPQRILGSVSGTEQWAYRFDFINTGTDAEIKRYRTPWRSLPVENTISGFNEDIAEIKINTNNPNDNTYTYYVTSSKPHSWLEDTGVTTAFTDIKQAEVRLFERMRENGQAGVIPTTLGNLAYTAGKTFNLAQTFVPSTLDLDDIDETLYNQMDYRFIGEDDLKDAVTALGHNIEALNNRTISVDISTAQTISVVYPTITVSSINAPIIPTTYNNFTSANKMTLSDFIIHAKEKRKTHHIKVIFLPNIYRRQGTVSDSAIDYVYLCSAPGIYINGLIGSSLNATGPVTTWQGMLNMKKNFTFLLDIVDTYVDCFTNLNDLYLNDVVTHMPRDVFSRGVYLVIYLKPYNQSMLDSYAEKTTPELKLINRSWDESAYKQTSSGVWAQARDIVYLDEVDEENPTIIAESREYIVFEDRLIVWSGNKVYISEEGNYYHFISTMKKIFPEEVLKVISFKNVLLVFTTQNLYAIYRAELDTFTGNYTEQGLPEFIKTIVWLQQPVLYNINPERKYLDVIQVYNQMILFYSNEGQLYMIKPSTMIDSETQFGIQYFNKSANDILANYEQYINERLKLYGKLDIENELDYVTKADVQVHALVDIDLIKVFYSVPGRITFVLIYDVVNNRYTTYDTLSFTNINFVQHVEGGEFYLTQKNNASYFTLPVIGINNVDQNADIHYTRMFKKEPIFTFIDSGNLNLNNHLRKRLRDLRVVLKNLDATKILYNAELLIDDTIIRPFYGPDFKVRMLNGPDSMMTVDKVPVEDLNELFGMNETIGIEGARTDLNSYYLHSDVDFYERNSLLKTETLNSSRLIEYNSSILGVGKVVRLRLQFISKGKYKLQSFGIVYKERRV
jgi:hypothetical protein